MNLPLQIGVAVHHLAKKRRLELYYNFIYKYIDISGFKLLNMDTDSDIFHFQNMVVILHFQKIALINKSK